MTKHLVARGPRGQAFEFGEKAIGCTIFDVRQAVCVPSACQRSGGLPDQLVAEIAQRCEANEQAASMALQVVLVTR